VEGEDGVIPVRTPNPESSPTASHPAPRSHGSAALSPALEPRTALLDRLLRAQEPVIAVTAPPGYGKTSLLGAWAERRAVPVAWVACDQVSGAEVVENVRRALDLSDRPTAVVLDQVEALTDAVTRHSVAAFARKVPAGSTLVLASREALPLAARLRVEQRLLEIGIDDLAFTLAEASRLLAASGVELPETETAELVARTEGWPAALYLAALAIRAGDVSPSRPFTGTDRLMGDYLRSEVLDRLSRSQRRLLVRTSVLDPVCGPLCDALTGGKTATRGLERLHHRTLLLLPLAREGGWYRYHPLLRQLLQAELRAESPDLVPELHVRASAWFEEVGDRAQAIDHAYLAGDGEAFGRLVLEAMQPVWASGQIDTVLRWMEQLGRRAPESHTPAMIAHGALIFALLGRPGDAERWAAVAESLPATGELPDGDTALGTLAYLRANLCCDGPATMRRDAVEALAGLGPASPYRATMIHTEGLSYLLEGDLERADASFAHAYELSASLETSPLTALVLAEQVQVAVERDEWTSADSLVARALEEVARGPYDDYWTSALVFASAAHVAAHRGDMSEAREHARRAARLRPLLTYALPVVSTQALVELARAYLALVDPAGALAVLEQVRGILQQRPDLGTLATAARKLDERVSQITAATPVGASSLTAAELRLVPLLPTHLTYPEIGERLFISRHTVKTHAGSVYRKLGASSRAEAVERIKQLGLA
jgi:LuxR family maltose regulon positive regulatory protein